MPSLDQAISWIESHKETVDLLKWSALLLLAWATGIFKLVRDQTRRPKVIVDPRTSRCLLAPGPERSGMALAVFLLDVGIINQSREPIVVRDLSMRFRQSAGLRPWGRWIAANSLPARVSHHFGDQTKLLRNWFTNFNDGSENLTIDARIDGLGESTGYILFIAANEENSAPSRSTKTIGPK